MQSPSFEVHVPENLIALMKEFVKTVIRQQPKDLLTWSEKYFRDRAENSKLQYVTNRA